MKKEIKFVRTEFGYEAQVNGVTKGYIWRTKGVTKYYVSYPTQYFYHLKDAKLAVAERINNL